MDSARLASQFPGLVEFFDSGGRIGAFGASGAGKTFFCELLAKGFAVSLKPEGVREWLRDRGLVYAALTPSQSVDLQRYCLDCCDQSAAAIFDRTSLDSLVYASWTLPDGQIDEFRQRTPRSLAPLDLLLFFPAYGGYLADDGVRISDLKHQTEIAALMFVQAKYLGILHKVVVYDHSKSVEDNVSVLEREALRLRKTQ